MRISVLGEQVVETVRASHNGVFELRGVGRKRPSAALYQILQFDLKLEVADPLLHLLARDHDTQDGVRTWHLSKCSPRHPGDDLLAVRSALSLMKGSPT